MHGLAVLDVAVGIQHGLGLAESPRVLPHWQGLRSGVHTDGFGSLFFGPLEESLHRLTAAPTITVIAAHGVVSTLMRCVRWHQRDRRTFRAADRSASRLCDR